MASKSFLPDKDADLLAWSSSFSTQITAAPLTFGLTAALATNYTTLQTAYATAYAAAKNISTRTRGTVAAKNTAKNALIANTRILAKMVEATPTVTDQQKRDLGLSVKNPPSPIPAPSVSPALDIVSVIGRTVKLRLHEASIDNNKRGKPAGVQGASVYSFIGSAPPSDPSQFRFEGNTTRTTIDVIFPATVPGGSMVWLIASWYNPRALAGPACAPISAYLQGSSAAAA